MRGRQQTGSWNLKCLFLSLLVTAFLAAVYLYFHSGLVSPDGVFSWPPYLLYLGLTVAVWSVLETRIPVIEALFKEGSLSRWFGQLLRLDLLTLATVSAGTFFWRGYDFSRYTVGAFWAFHLCLTLAAAWALRVWRLHRHGLERLEIWTASEEISDQQLADYARGVFRTAEIRRLAAADEILDHLKTAQRISGHQERLLALGTRQLWLFPEMLRALQRMRTHQGILLLATPGPAEERGSLVLAPVGTERTESLDYLVSKRIVDVVFAALGLLLLAPLMFLIGALIRFTSGRPIVFSQERVGRQGIRFRLYKFRTLPREALRRSDYEWFVRPSNGLSAFLRSTGLDELPQLVNVVRGEMSLVGPRPERPHFVDRFQSELPFYSLRHRLQAGITGWAQVNGWRGDTSIARRVEYDLQYLNNWSLAFDFRILGRTFVQFFRSVWEFGRAPSQTRHAGAI